MNYVCRFSRRFAALLCCALSAGLALAAVGVSPALAATPSPAWAIRSLAAPTHFSPADSQRCLEEIGSLVAACDGYVVTATNAGSQPTDGTAVSLTDTLPAGLTVQAIHFEWSGLQGADLFSLCTTTTTTTTVVQCNFHAPLQPDQTLRLTIYLTADEAGPAPLTNSATVSGGGAPPASTEPSNSISSESAPFGVESFASPFLGLDGQPDSRAAAHPNRLFTTIGLNSKMQQSSGSTGLFGPTSTDDLRDAIVDLPPGLAGSALSAPTCTLAQLASEEGRGCPREAVVGHVVTAPESSTSVLSPLFNVAPEHGVAAEFAFIDAVTGVHVLYASLAPTPSGYVLRTTSREITQVSLYEIAVDFYGDPAAHFEAETGEPAVHAHVPTFTNPANCDGRPLTTHIHMDSWQNPGSYNPDGSPDLSDPAWASASTESPPVTGCNQLAGLFKPTIEAAPETDRADSPTGLDVTLKVPQSEGVETLGTPPLKKAVVTLPQGMSVNPSSANGRVGCSLADLGMSPSGEPNAAPPHCPDASKIGTVELETPALEGVLQGQIYVARQSENPFNTLLAIYIVVNDPTTGVVVKIPGEVRADPNTGQLQTIVDNSPQFPFSELRTHFFGGTRAALRTPAVCGKYEVTSSLTPWSAPQSGLPATPSASFEITQAAGGGACPSSAAAEPNAPHFALGTETPLAGAFSPLGLELSREDGSQELSGLNLTLPPGLIGKLAGLSECSDAQLATVAARSGLGQGAAEQSSPSCPASSEVGTVTIGAGAGLAPYYAQGHAYLAGPYKGAPLSLAVITPALAGPFDLGDVLVRNALYVNPETAQITAKSDPIPHILFGIPLDVRSIALNMTRHEFILNPTNCEKFTATGAATSVLGQSAPLSSPFQVGGCKALGFKPKLALSLKGATKRNRNPALKAVLTYPKKGAYANIAKAAVTLPHSEFLDQSHIKTICTRVQFAEGAVPGEKCPPASIYGFAKATTPLLDHPVQGPVYLRASSHKLPDLVAALNGQIDVALAGKIDTGKSGGIRNTFEVVPDAPVTKFTLEMQGGKKGLLVNSENICAKPQHAVARFTAQNGKVDDSQPLIANSCKGKAKKHGKGKHGHRHRAAG